MKYKVALITMPWNSPKYPSIQVGLLKSILENKGLSTDAYYFNLRWVKYIGLDTFNELCEVRDGLLSEWIFNRELFGDFIPEGYNQDYLDYLVNVRRLHFKGPKLKERIYKMRENIVKEFIDDCANIILKKQYNLIGFTCTFNQLVSSLCLAKKLKDKNPSIHIVFGGTTFDGNFATEFHTSFPWIDSIFKGQADSTFPNYVYNIINNKKVHHIPGLTYKSNNKIIANKPVSHICIDDNPYPDYVDYFNDIENLKVENNISIIPDALLIETSRGCWWAEKYQCRFCSITEDRKGYSVKSNSNILNEIKTQMLKYGINRFYAVDRLSISDNCIDESNLSKLVEEKLNIVMYINVRANLEKEEIRKLFEAGIKLLLVGIESFNTHLLQLVGKGVSAMQNINFLKWATFYKIQVGYFLLFQIPGENKEDYEDMLQKIPLIHHFYPPSNYQQVFVYRNTPYFNDKEKHNIELEISPDWKYVFPSNVLKNGSNNTFSYTSKININENLSKMYKRMERKWFIWKEMFHKNKCFMVCFEIGDSMFIYDTRYRNFSKIELKGLEKEVYKLTLDKPIHLNQIIEKTNNSAKELDQILQLLNEKKLIYSENRYYLGLAHYLSDKEHIKYFITKY